MYSHRNDFSPPAQLCGLSFWLCVQAEPLTLDEASGAAAQIWRPTAARIFFQSPEG
jgi:hypothetical protein